MSIIRAVKKEEKRLTKKKKCIACNEEAEFCMRGLPENIYCRDCAQEYFKFLNYLEKL
jgi:hypothetical protein